jgi:hypothetical protein
MMLGELWGVQPNCLHLQWCHWANCRGDRDKEVKWVGAENMAGYEAGGN